MPDSEETADDAIEGECEVAELPNYPVWASEDEQRRWYIFETLAPLDYAAKEKMAEAPKWEAWLKSGQFPDEPTKPGKKPPLSVVPS